ncbi:hypothetical protein [Kitasatospora phosalacinea]|uniref:Uncharacterized protein n=1 Tax=Kitasatospora phosalacinea TaxID=2065 RepID=A0A9W6PNI4_9ACTN|nr:hypothetical protein [Kitasatospora phosalacinea]GLW59525.1 hypothetical protein Kpho01_75350 [Kitasatospora phosalacinea]
MTPRGPEPGPPGGGGRLEQRVVAQAGFAYGAIGADIHVFGDGTPVYVLENWRPGEGADDAWLAELPSRMLNARWEVVGFTGRTEELAALRAWCGSGPRLAVRWLHGPGGQGKTRLAARLARERAAEGWKVVTATEGPGSVLPPPGSQDLRTDGAPGLLLLVDYADRWPLSHLTWLLSNALLHDPAVPARVLMIARDTGPWPAVRAALADHRAGTSAQELAALGDGEDPAGRRAQMFTAARDGFAARYGTAPPGRLTAPPWLDGPEFGLTLAVHMAALVAVDAHLTGRRSPTDAAGLTLYLLDREHLHWARRHGDGTHRLAGRGTREPPWTTPPEVMNRVVFTAALTGPLPPPTGAQALDRLDLGLPAHRLLADHASCYPPADPARATVLEPLQPDRLAEDFAALTLPGHRADYPAREWAPGTVTALTDGPPHPGWSRRTLLLLAAAAERWPHVADGHLFPLLRERPELAVAAGSPVLSALAALPGAPFELLEAVEARLPPYERTDLAPGAADLARVLADHRLARTRDPAQRAAVHARLANALVAAGRYRENLDALVTAVELYRPLAQADPRTFEQPLAFVLSNLANRLGRYGERWRSLPLAREAVDTGRRIGLMGPAGDGLGGAALLVNLASQLRGAGRTAEALEVEHEALEIFWRASWIKSSEEEARAHLPVCLVNLAMLLPPAYFRGEAVLAALEQAVALDRGLAADDPPRYGASLAYALTLLAGRLVSHYQSAEAIARAAPDSPGLHRPVAAGWRQRAVALAREAVDIDRRLVPDNPAVLRPQLADGLEVLHLALAAAGQPEEAAAALAESTALRARHAPPAAEAESARPAGPVRPPPPEGHHRWMLAATRAGVTLYAYLASVDPETHRPGLAEALEYVTAVPSFDRDGIPDREAALPLWEDLVDADPPTYGPRYAHALAVLSSLQRTAGLSAEAGRTEAERARVEALVAAAEEERQRRRLAPRLPWGTAEEIDAEARRLTAAGDDAGLWALALAVPVADGARIARALTARWQLPEPAARALAERLAAADPPTRTARRSAEAAHRELPVSGATEDGLGFAHGRPVLAVHGLQKNGSWALRTLDLGTGRLKVVNREGPNTWRSQGCLGPGRIVALRELPEPPHARLVLLDGRSALELASGNALKSARVAATADGYVVGLALMRAVLVGTGGDPPVAVDLGGTGLWRCDRLAVDPTGTRIALTDGRRTVLVDLPDGRVVAAADTEGAVEAVFLAPDRLVTAGVNGGLCRWEAHDGRLRRTAAADTPLLRPLFAVPGWRVVGGWALGRPHFHDTETLDPVPEPPATAALLDVTTAWQSSADGRYVAHGGSPPPSGPQHGSRTLLHDLHHPAAWLARPAAAVTRADLPVLAALAERAERRHRPLLALLHDLAAHRLAED